MTKAIESLTTFLPKYLQENLKSANKLTLKFVILSSVEKLFVLVIDDCKSKFAIEIYKDAARQTLYIQKIDSNLRLKGLASTVIKGLMDYFKATWYIYVATGDTYLFPSSTKPGRDDRALIKWWMSVVDHRKVKTVWIPGESKITTKSLFPSDTWEWGLGVDSNAVATDVLPQYEDDLVTKAIGYADPNASVKDLMGIMECMEMHAGLRALIWLRESVDGESVDQAAEFEQQFEGLEVVEDMDSVLRHLTSLNFATDAISEKSTRDFINHLGLSIEDLPCCCVEASNDLVEGLKAEISSQVNSVSASMIKKKSTVNTISSSLVKKKAAATINRALIKKKPKLS